jgi:GTP-binding protein
MAGLIGIVGRPNVGKSALFNRIVGRRIAIVHDEPGVTRDRVTAEAEWAGKGFTLVDTGGIGLVRGEKAHDVITAAALEQVELAIEAANAIILVVNVQEGLTPLDEEVARRLRKSGKPILLAVNKVDTSRAEGGTADFARLGLENVFPVSAIHGEGIEPLMNAAVKFLAEGGLVKPEGEPPIKLAIVGRPNVGKSSIINALTQSQRVIVSPIPGTTRDAVDVPFEVETEGVRQQYVLIDTAGVRQERRVDNSIEFYSVKRTEDSIGRADIVVFVIDAETGITGQDKKIGGKIVEARKACIVVVNKWDLVEEDVREVREQEIERRSKKDRDKHKKMSTLGEFGAWVQENLFFLDYAPVIFTSAKSGFHLERLLEAVRYVTAQLQQQIPTSLLNRALNDAIEQRQPVSAQGHRLKFFYATQVKKAPPIFLLFVNRDELFSDQYSKYLGDQLRKSFGYEGCPIILVPKPRPKTIETIRRHKPDTRRPSMAKRPNRGGQRDPSGRAPRKFRKGR